MATDRSDIRLARRIGWYPGTASTAVDEAQGQVGIRMADRGGWFWTACAVFDAGTGCPTQAAANRLARAWATAMDARIDAALGTMGPVNTVPCVRIAVGDASPEDLGMDGGSARRRVWCIVLSVGHPPRSGVPKPEMDRMAEARVGWRVVEGTCRDTLAAVAGNIRGLGECLSVTICGRLLIHDLHPVPEAFRTPDRHGFTVETLREVTEGFDAAGTTCVVDIMMAVAGRGSADMAPDVAAGSFDPALAEATAGAKEDAERMIRAAVGGPSAWTLGVGYRTHRSMRGRRAAAGMLLSVQADGWNDVQQAATCALLPRLCAAMAKRLGTAIAAGGWTDPIGIDTLVRISVDLDDPDRD